VSLTLVDEVLLSLHAVLSLVKTKHNCLRIIQVFHEKAKSSLKSGVKGILKQVLDALV